ncbi:MAG: hypothetical protein ACYDEB_13835 [Dehalococcoidia bacterium]
MKSYALLVAFFTVTLLAVAPAGRDAGVNKGRRTSSPEVVFRMSDEYPDGISIAQAPAIVSYSLPSDAGQGDDGWYVIQLHARVVLASAASLNRFAYLTAATSGRTSAQVRFANYPYHILRWDGVSLAAGGFQGYTHSGEVNLYYTNYLQRTGVTPGLNSLSLDIDRDVGMKWRDVVIEPDTSIVRIAQPPPELAITARPSARRVIIGQTFAVVYSLRSTGWEARGVRIHSRVDAGMTAASPDVTFEALGERQEGALSFTAVTPGDHVISILARSANAGSAITDVRVTAIAQ